MHPSPHGITQPVITYLYHVTTLCSNVLSPCRWSFGVVLWEIVTLGKWSALRLVMTGKCVALLYLKDYNQFHIDVDNVYNDSPLHITLPTPSNRSLRQIFLFAYFNYRHYFHLGYIRTRGIYEALWTRPNIVACCLYNNLCIRFPLWVT